MAGLYFSTAPKAATLRIFSTGHTRSFRLLGLLVVFLLLPGSREAAAQESAFLLGYRYDEPIRRPLPYYAGSADSLSRPVYRTLLLTNNNGQIAFSEEVEGLLVPRSNGFWHVDAKRSIYNSWVEDFLWSAPPGKSPELPGIQAYNGENCEGHRIQKLNYVGTDYLAVEVSTAGYCEDAAHPWNFNTLAMIPIDSTAHLGVPISSVLGDDGRKALNTAAERFLANLSLEEQELYLPAPDEASWGLIRREGQWTVQGRLDPGSVNFGEPADFDVDIQLPVSMVGRGRLDPSWTDILTFAPDAVDAFSAPTGDMLVILHPESLTVHRFVAGDIGPAALTTTLPPGATTVMARWAVGPRAASWTEPFSLPADRSVTVLR